MKHLVGALMLICLLGE